MPQCDTEPMLTHIQKLCSHPCSCALMFGQTVRIMQLHALNRACNTHINAHAASPWARVATGEKSQFLTKNALRCTLLQRLCQTMSKGNSPKKTQSTAETGESTVRSDPCSSTQCGCTRIMPNAPRTETRDADSEWIHGAWTYRPTHNQEGKHELLGSGGFAVGVDADSGADGCRSRSRSITTHLGCPSRHVILVEIGDRLGGGESFHLTRQRIIVQGGCHFGRISIVMPREFRGPAYHSQATSNASLS